MYWSTVPWQLNNNHRPNRPLLSGEKSRRNFTATRLSGDRKVKGKLLWVVQSYEFTSDDIWNSWSINSLMTMTLSLWAYAVLEYMYKLYMNCTLHVLVKHTRYVPVRMSALELKPLFEFEIIEAFHESSVWTNSIQNILKPVLPKEDGSSTSYL